MGLRVSFPGALIALAAGAAAAAPLSDYKGDDGGWLVFSVTTDRGHLVLLGQAAPAGTDVSIDFRRVGERSGERVRAAPSALLFGRRDYSGPLAPTTRQLAANLDDPEDVSSRDDTYDTEVVALRLSPGDYEIAAVNIGGASGNMHYSSRYNRRRLPFHITAGRTLYLGALTPAPREGKNILGLPAFDYWNLIFDDEHDRDVPIAEHRTPDLGPVDNLWQALPQQSGLDTGDRSAAPGSGR